MKVLILHQHFKTPYGGGAIRSYYLAKALVDRGIQTVVITGHNEGQSRKDNVDGIEVHYLSVAYDNRFGFSRRIYSFFLFAIRAAKFAAGHQDAKICYAISTPLTTGLAAMRIRWKYGIPYVFEVGDLWPEAPIQMGFISNRVLQRLAYWMEHTIYKGAESLVALSPAIRGELRRKVSEKPIHLIPNMADTDFFRPGEKRPALQEKFGVSGKFVVSYIGAMGVANGLFHFLDCAHASQRHGLAIHFLLCGDGGMLDELKQYAQKSDLRNVSFIVFQNREGVGELMNVTDACFISYLPVKILETGSPNKYFDGLAAGKLIIINFEGWIREEIEREWCGVYVNHSEPEDFVNKIRPFIADELFLSKYQGAARGLAEQKYSRTFLAEKFGSMLQQRYCPPSCS